MSKLKLFLENFLIYGLGGIISKAIPFFMLPIVVRLMPNSQYFGLSDMSNTIMNLCGALAGMGMYDAMYRYFFEKDDLSYKRRVCSTAFIFVLISSFLTMILLMIFRVKISEFFFNNTDTAYLVYLTAIATFMSVTNNIVSAPTRMENKRVIFLLTNTIAPIISYAISIPLLIRGYYVIALPLASVLSFTVIEIIFIFLNHKWFRISAFDKGILKELLVFGLPLVPNFLIYWIFNSCDRLMITKIIGIGESGVYSVGAKIGMASQLIYTAFAGGWQYFAFSTMKENDQVSSNSQIFEYLGVISYATTTIIAAWSYILFRLLFPEEYLRGYIIAPYLFLAPLLQMLYQVIGNQFLVIKKTWPNVLILSAGAFANILFNLVFIPLIGIEGASIATLLGYTISILFCILILFKMKLITISKKFVLSSLILVIYIVIWRFLFANNCVVGTLIALSVIILFMLLYRDSIRKIMQSIIKMKNE